MCDGCPLKFVGRLNGGYIFSIIRIKGRVFNLCRLINQLPLKRPEEIYGIPIPSILRIRSDRLFTVTPTWIVASPSFVGIARPVTPHSVPLTRYCVYGLALTGLGWSCTWRDVPSGAPLASRRHAFSDSGLERTFPDFVSGFRFRTYSPHASLGRLPAPCSTVGYTLTPPGVGGARI